MDDRMNHGSIRIGAGVKRIAINDDPERVIVFDPTDVTFVERFQDLVRDFTARQAEFERLAKEIDKVTDADENGLPVNLDQRLKFMREVCEFSRERIDHLFGEGTSQKAFGESLSLEMVGEFFEGLTPFIQSYRAEKLAKYMPPKERKAKRSAQRSRKPAA